MPYALVIFDLDGTLADSFPWFLTVVNGVARDYGFRQIADDEIEPLRRAGARDILRRLEVPAPIQSMTYKRLPRGGGNRPLCVVRRC